MKLILVYSKFSDEFRNKVVAPLQSIYSNCQVINLQEAVDCFLTADRKWDAVVVEVSSELNEDSPKLYGATLFRPTCKKLLGELIRECERFAPIIACYNELELTRLDGAYPVITENFKSAFITDMLIRWRSGLKPRELSDNQIRNSYNQDYPLPEREVLALLQLELPDLPDQARLVKHVYDSVEQNDVSALIEVLIMMRTTRFLAQLELEGRPYVMSFALGTNLQEIKCLYTLRDSMQISLAPTAIAQIEDLAELVQGWGCFVGIDPNNGRINGVYQFPFTETEKLGCFSQLANSVHGIVFNLPGNRTVETYTKNGLSLRYDGFEWVCQPLDKLKEELGKLKLGTIPMQRLMEAINQLSLRRLSSIIAIDPYDFDCKVMNVECVDLRPNCIQTLKELFELDVETLVSIFRLDGAHLLKRNMFYKIAQQVSYDPKSPQERSISSGTGSRAAKALSEAYPFSLVIKVSASGGRIKIYKGNARTLGNLLLDQEKSADFRKEAAKAAAKFTDVEERKIIIPALCSAAEKDPHQTIRNEAIKSLGIYKEPSTYKVIVAALNDKSEFVRGEAVDALIGFERPESIELLIKALKDSAYYPVVEVAAKRLCELRDKKAINPLFDALTEIMPTKENSTLAAIAEALGQICEIGDTKAIELLIKLLEETSNAPLRTAVAEALGKIGDLRALPVLETASTYHPDSFFQENPREAAKSAIKAILGRKAGNGA